LNIKEIPTWQNKTTSKRLIRKILISGSRSKKKRKRKKSRELKRKRRMVPKPTKRRRRKRIKRKVVAHNRLTLSRPSLKLQMVSILSTKRSSLSMRRSNLLIGT